MAAAVSTSRRGQLLVPVAAVAAGLLALFASELQGCGAAQLDPAVPPLYPNGVVPLVVPPELFRSELPWRQARRILDEAVAQYERLTPVRLPTLHDLPAEGVYVNVTYPLGSAGGGCHAVKQDEFRAFRISLPMNEDGPGCSTMTVVHEIGHILGMPHEVTRPDAGDFVTIEWDRVGEQQRRSFEPRSEPSFCGDDPGELPADYCDHEFTRYDYGSVMGLLRRVLPIDGPFQAWVEENRQRGGATASGALGQAGSFFGLSQWDRDAVAANFGAQACTDNPDAAAPAAAAQPDGGASWDSACVGVSIGDLHPRSDLNGDYWITGSVGGNPAWTRTGDPPVTLDYSPARRRWRLVGEGLGAASNWAAYTTWYASMPPSSWLWKVFADGEWQWASGVVGVNCTFAVDEAEYFRWDTGPWGPCLPGNGGAVRTRVVHCRDPAGRCAHDVDCAYLRVRPPAQMRCPVAAPAPCDFGPSHCASLLGHALDEVACGDWELHGRAEDGEAAFLQTVWDVRESRPTPGTRAAVMSPPVVSGVPPASGSASAGAGTCTVTFRYLLVGGADGATLSLDVVAGSPDGPTGAGDDGNDGGDGRGTYSRTSVWCSNTPAADWRDAAATVPALRGAAALAFVVTRGYDAGGQIAIDDVSFSGGCADAATAPAAPAAVRATPLDSREGTLLVSWTEAWAPAGALVTAYRVAASQCGVLAANASVAVDATDAGSAMRALEVMLVGLLPGVEATVTVLAENAVGTGAASCAAAAVPSGATVNGTGGSGACPRAESAPIDARPGECATPTAGPGNESDSGAVFVDASVAAAQCGGAAAAAARTYDDTCAYGAADDDTNYGTTARLPQPVAAAAVAVAASAWALLM